MTECVLDVRRRKQITKITEQVKQYCYSKVNEPTRVLLQMQLNNQIKEERGRRYTLREKSMAALWLKLGPRPYNVLRRLWFALPSRRTIMRVIVLRNCNFLHKLLKILSHIVLNPKKFNLLQCYS